jgi:hypothetical protein
MHAARWEKISGVGSNCWKFQKTNGSQGVNNHNFANFRPANFNAKTLFTLSDQER